MREIDIVACEKPQDSGGSGGIELGGFAEAVDVFFGGDEVAELVGFGFIGERELNDDAGDCGVGVGRTDFVGECL